MPLALLALFLAACSSVSLNPGPVRETEPVLARGWSFVEPARDFTELEAGVVPVSYSGPLLAGNKVVFGSSRFGLTVLAKENGQVLWQKRMNEGIGALPFIHQNRVFAGALDGTLAAFDLDGGSEIWSVSLGGPVRGTMTFAQERLFVATADEALHAVDPGTGKILWSYRRPAHAGTSIRGGGNPSVIAGRVWAGFSDGTLVALNPEDGSVQWERQFRDNAKFVDIDARVVGWKEGMLVATYDGKLRYLRRDGAQLWEFPAGGSRAPILGEGDVIYFPSSDGNVYAIDGSSGKEIWRHTMRRGVPTGMALMAGKEGKTLLTVGSDERVVALHPQSGALLSQLSFGRGSGSYSPIATDEETKSFYVLSSYSRVYQIRLNR